MKTKQIWNIVFYKYYENNKVMKKACVFYRDGSVEDTTYEEGLNACEQIVKERKITSKNAFKEMINKDIVHVMSADELKVNFDKFVSHEVLTQDIIDEAIEEHMNEVDAVKIYEPKKKDADSRPFVVIPPVVEPAKEPERRVFEEKATEKVNPVIIPTYEKPKEKVEYVYEEPERTVVVDREPVKPRKKTLIEKYRDSSLGTKIASATLATLMFLGLYSVSKKQTLNGEIFRNGIIANDAIPKELVNKILHKEENKQEVETVEVEQTADVEKTIKEENTVKEADTTRNTTNVNSNNGNSGNESQSAQSAQAAAENGLRTFYNPGTNSVLVIGDNDYYYDYTYEELLAVTTNETQKRAMQNIYTAINNYNITFADAYVEEGKDIRAALSFDELVALQQAYNDYTKEQIKAIFNGAEIDAAKMSMDYKAATLQLMGAHIIENSQHPVDMSVLLETKEGKEFYHKYHKLFLAAKEAQDENQKLQLVKAFYDNVRKDFPITNEVRTQGIMHADQYASLESYKLSVIPMIAASEMLFQNLRIDYTLNDQEVNFLNDVGLCNVAFSKFEKIQTITLNRCKDDKTNPLYEQYRDAIIKELKAKNRYVIDDAHRDLSQLDAFLRAINGNKKRFRQYVGGFYEWTETHYEVKTWTETETTYREETEIIEAEIPEEEKEKIDQELEAENEKAREEAEKKAEEERQRLQEEADKEAEKIHEEVIEAEQDLQEKIEEANEQIEMNQDNDPTNDKPVNEEDFGEHNVDFYEEFEDGNGNLENYVEEITTDPTGDQTGQPLPDPEETGRAFDAQAEDYEYDVTTGSYTIETETTESSSNDDFWVEYDTPTETYSVETETTPMNENTDSSSNDDFWVEYDTPTETYSVETETNTIEGDYSSSNSDEEFWVEYDIPEFQTYVEGVNDAPVETYSAPEETYSAPAYSETVDTYTAPVETYSAPVETYSAPVETYSAPVETYSAPVETYSAPVESYSNSDAVEIYVEAMASEPSYEEDAELVR